MQIELYQPRHLEAIVHLSLRAWAPVFESMQKAMDAEIYQEFYPGSWQLIQQKEVEEVCAAENTTVWVSVDADSILGFVAVKVNRESNMGEITMVAVDPEHQRRNIGTALIQFALNWIKMAGLSIAMVETGGDPGHAPARLTYEKLGFRLFPIARYFKKL